MATIEIPKVRKESTVIMYVSLTDNGVTVDWTSLSEIKPFMYSDEQHCIAGKCTAEIATGAPETLIVRYPTTAPQFLGQNSLLIRCTYDGNEKSFDVPVLEFVDRSSEATGVTVIEDPELPVAIEVQDVDTSVLDDAIAAALDAAAKATAAAELVPLDILAQCQAAAEAAEAAAENCAPVIGDNGNWWIYDYDAGEYVDSGKPSRGIQGEQGIQGIQGIQGNTGSSVDYPYELVNNRTTDDATKGLSAAEGKRLGDDLSQLDQKVGDAWKVESPGRIANGVWWNDFGYTKHIAIPIYGGDLIDITPSATTYYSVLAGYSTPVAGGTPDFATGYTDRVGLSARTVFVAPSDARWLYIQSYGSSLNLIPSSIKVNGMEIKDEHSTINSIGGLGQRVIALENKTVKESDLGIKIISNNLANPALIQDGKFVNSTGGIASSNDWSLIQIPASAGKKYTFGGFYLGRTGYYAFYNAAGQNLYFDGFADPQGRTAPVTTSVAPANTAYLLVDIKTGSSPSSAYTNLQINEGGSFQEYDAYEDGVETILGNGLFAKDYKLREEYDTTVKRAPQKQRDFNNTGYVKYSDGTLSGGGYVSTDFLPVSEGMTVKVTKIYASSTVAILAAYSTNAEAGYLQSKSVAGTGGFATFDYVVPENVAYIRLSCNSNQTYLSEVSYGFIPYVPYVLNERIAESIDSPDNTLATIGIVKGITSPKSPVRLYPQTKLPCVSFQFDDIPANDADVVSLFESYGLSCAFAFVASAENIANKAETYRNYQRRGFQIQNHSIDGTIFNTTNYTYQTAMAAIMTALNRIQKTGMVCNGFVSPSSTMADEFIPILKAAHAYAFTSATTSASANGRAQDTCQLHRFSIESTPMADIKSYIDACITNDQIMTFYGHAYNFGDTYSGEEWNIEKVAEVIEYCIAKRDAGLLYIGGTDDCVKYFFDL